MEKQVVIVKDLRPFSVVENVEFVFIVRGALQSSQSAMYYKNKQNDMFLD